MVDIDAHESIYVDGEYLERNPSWHVEDSPWKAQQILRMIKKNNLCPQTVCEVGCGVGEVLRQLQHSMNSECEFDGYEISPQAYKLCQERANNKLRFHLGDFFETKSHFDLILLIDLIEHLENYYGFLRQIRSYGEYKILHIPLQLCVVTILRPIWLQIEYNNAGHIHYFTKETGLRSLKHCGFSVLDWFYTQSFIELPAKTRLGRRGQMVKRVAQIVKRVNEDWASRLFGGTSLMVLAK